MSEPSKNPSALDTHLSAPAAPDWPRIPPVPAARTPIPLDKTPAELAEHLNRIIQWGEANRAEARREEILFWALKIPVIIATAGYGLMISKDWKTALAVCGALASACALIEGFYRPGALRNFHHKAHFDLADLADDLVTKWQIGVLNGEKDLNAFAARLIEESRTRKGKISAYLADAEATLGKEQPKKKK